jgi:serine/threonine-protein kinase
MSAQHPTGDEPTAFRPSDESPTVVPVRRVQLTPGTILGDRYRIVSLIGRGGMGEVYRADDLKLGQTVALKFLARHGDSQRLIDEVRLGRQVSHPNVCRLYDVAEVDGQLFITMEFVDGEDLASLLRRVGRLSSEKALAVSRDIIAGVAAAHEKGVVHRDLKPANVMVDGRGRARVTDFGLAVAGIVADGAGTPAYMAPEQLQGGAASEQSDIYALGLIMYELFTGRRAFDASSTNDLLSRQRRGEFTRPSMVTKDVSPAVERVISRCLDPDPAARPSSAEDLARELPGGDALAAAIAAGETPSPQMVAASLDRGELSVAAAGSWLAAVILLLILYALLTPRTMVHRRVPVKSPDVLEDRAAEVLAATGHDLRRADFDSVFAIDRQWLQRREGSAVEPTLVFLYRQSPRALTPENFEHRVVSHDPPLIYSGMADVVLASDGRLRSFVVVPPQHEKPPAAEAEVDWQPFLRLAGFSGPLAPVRSEWAGVVDSDRRWAWLAQDGTRVEARSFHGKPVSFDVVKPWATPSRMEERRETASEIGIAALVTITCVFWIAAAALAFRNLRRGQGDRKGAWRVASWVAVASMAGWWLLSHHTANAWSEMTSIIVAAGLSFTGALGTWVGYVAIEPLVRRRWPRVLISESRLIAGFFRDPMVGRDLLVGVAVGTAFVFLRSLTALLPGGSPYQSANLALTDVRYIGWFLGGAFVIATYGGIVGATLLVGVHAVTRDFRLTCVVLAPMAAAVILNDVSGPLWVRALFSLTAATIALAVVFRFGLLAYSAMLFSYGFLRRMPITLDPDDWYFGRSLFALALFAALALFGFLTSVGGKKWLPDLAVE